MNLEEQYLLNLEEQYDRIYKYLYFRIHDRHTAEDLTQETFLRFIGSRTYRDENRQLQYVGKWVWLLSTALLLFITWICYGNNGNYPFALTPLLAVGILVETERSFRWKMAELEYTARFSLRSVMLARMFLVGTVETAGLLVVIWAVQPRFSYSLSRVFLYMMVPYLSASLLGSVYERKHRTGNGWGSIVICLLSSAFFAAAPYCMSTLYEERFTAVWVVALILLIVSLGSSVRRWISRMEEPAWNL